MSRKSISALLPIYLTVFLASFSSSSLANGLINDSKITIVTPEWEHFTESDGSGFYFDLLRLVYEPLGIKIDYKITPWARSKLMLERNQADAMIGSYKEQEELFHYPDHPVWLDIAAAAFKTDQENWAGTNSLSMKKVGWIRGYNYDQYIDVKMDIIELIDNKQAWKLLSLGRIDFYLDSITDIRLHLETDETTKTLYRVESFLTMKMYMRLAKTPKGVALARIYDQEILKHIEGGGLRSLYKKWGYEQLYPDFVRSTGSNN